MNVLPTKYNICGYIVVYAYTSATTSKPIRTPKRIYKWRKSDPPQRVPKIVPTPRKERRTPCRKPKTENVQGIFERKGNRTLDCSGALNI